MNNPDHISESLETIFWVKILKFFDADPGSGLEKLRIWDSGWKKIPDQQHCLVNLSVASCLIGRAAGPHSW
jgi:hypothetical protein